MVRREGREGGRPGRRAASRNQLRYRWRRVRAPGGESLDIKLIRRDPEAARAALARRGAGEAVEDLLAADERRRELIQAVEERRATQNKASEEIAAAKREGQQTREAITQMREFADELKSLVAELIAIEAKLEIKLQDLPNLPDTLAPDTEEVLREVGDKPDFDFEPKDHLDLGTALDVIDMEHAAQSSGSRFAFLKGDLVPLEFALVQYALGKLAERGFRPVVPPVLVREEAMFNTGFLPTDRAQIYETAADDLYLVGTSEVSLAALHAGEIMAEDQLPRRYAGFSTCFRREAGAAGKDTHGIFRVHQFDKVEMFSFCRPKAAAGEHELLLAIEEEILQELGIPYRVVDIPVDDLGASAARKYDCEAWLPGQGRYRELTSTSNTTDYQARRLDCRYRPETGGPKHVHTLNGTAIAVGRTIIAIMENHQRADGTVAVPEVLHACGAPPFIQG